MHREPLGRFTKYSGWTKSVRTTLKPRLKLLFVGLRIESLQLRVLRWCEMDCVHPQNEPESNLFCGFPLVCKFKPQVLVEGKWEITAEHQTT